MMLFFKQFHDGTRICDLEPLLHLCNEGLLRLVIYSQLQAYYELCTYIYICSYHIYICFYNCFCSLYQHESMQNLICEVLSNTLKKVNKSEALSVLDTLWKSKIQLLDFSRCSKAAETTLLKSLKTFYLEKCLCSDVIQCCCKILVITD